MLRAHDDRRFWRHEGHGSPAMRAGPPRVAPPRVPSPPLAEVPIARPMAAWPGAVAILAVLLMSSFVHWYLFRHLGPVRGPVPIAPVALDEGRGEIGPDDPAYWRSQAAPEARAWRPWLAQRAAALADPAGSDAAREVAMPPVRR